MKCGKKFPPKLLFVLVLSEHGRMDVGRPAGIIIIKPIFSVQSRCHITLESINSNIDLIIDHHINPTLPGILTRNTRSSQNKSLTLNSSRLLVYFCFKPVWDFHLSDLDEYSPNTFIIIQKPIFSILVFFNMVSLAK